MITAAKIEIESKERLIENFPSSGKINARTIEANAEIN